MGMGFYPFQLLHGIVYTVLLGLIVYLPLSNYLQSTHTGLCDERQDRFLFSYILGKCACLF